MEDDLKRLILRKHLAKKEEVPTSLVEMYRRSTPLERLALDKQLKALLTHKKGG